MPFARTGIVDVVRVLELAAIAPGHLATLRARAESAARGYRLLSWAGPAPEDQVDGVAAVNISAEADMPRKPGHEPQLWDTDRVRMAEHLEAAQGMRTYTVAAKSEATGGLAGLTALSVDPDEPGWGFQQLTAVARQHRGHRLGLLVKVAMLELLAEREPQLTRIITGNADANEHMIAINSDLGFGVLDEWPCFEIGIAQVLAEPAPAVSQ